MSNPLKRLRDRLRILRRLADYGDNPVRFTKFVPSATAGQGLTLRIDERPPGAPLPVPPVELRLGYGSDDASFVESGRRDVSRMLAEIAKVAPSFDAGAAPILDLGCGSGRMIRQLEAQAARTEVWGVDVSAPHVNWMKTHLSPPFAFAAGTTLPHLTFPDGTFGLIYCGSVFTHIDDLAESWFLEVRRALSRDGIFYCTLHDEHALAELRRSPEHPMSAVVARHPGLSSGDPGDIVVDGTDTHSNVFYSRRYLSGFLGRIFTVLAEVPGAYGYQTAWILKRR